MHLSKDEGQTLLDLYSDLRVADVREKQPTKVAEGKATYADEVNLEEYIKIVEQEMAAAAEALDFERAALLRDQVFELRGQVGGKAAGKASGNP